MHHPHLIDVTLIHYHHHLNQSLTMSEEHPHPKTVVGRKTAFPARHRDAGVASMSARRGFMGSNGKKVCSKTLLNILAHAKALLNHSRGQFLRQKDCTPLMR